MTREMMLIDKAQTNMALMQQLQANAKFPLVFKGPLVPPPPPAMMPPEQMPPMDQGMSQGIPNEMPLPETALEEPMVPPPEEMLPPEQQQTIQ